MVKLQWSSNFQSISLGVGGFNKDKVWRFDALCEGEGCLSAIASKNLNFSAFTPRFSHQDFHSKIFTPRFPHQGFHDKIFKPRFTISQEAWVCKILKNAVKLKTKQSLIKLLWPYISQENARGREICPIMPPAAPLFNQSWPFTTYLSRRFALPKKYCIV